MATHPLQACAACKFQRRKCLVDCPLAPWFPPDEPRRFANAHRLFGVASILRLIGQNKNSVEDLMKTICEESDAREQDPVNGQFGTLKRLQSEVERLEELKSAWAEKLMILLLEDAHPAYNVGLSEPTQFAFTETTSYHMQHQQQQQVHNMPQQHPAYNGSLSELNQVAQYHMQQEVHNMPQQHSPYNAGLSESTQVAQYRMQQQVHNMPQQHPAYNYRVVSVFGVFAVFVELDLSPMW
ncbi:hypothetical protein AXG93_2461s1000 [Marchantia polymorpha subsp. ruderalis]|uniref:LOB domain-containing protein n=2 Tax=Marchantia polymorpha TaxID=3197 RepID=A0A176WPW1_MARPO|nr:hypothetical protein AXG93_2461s1000 [Marchantia polymorpha subsp. ruderalis]